MKLHITPQYYGWEIVKIEEAGHSMEISLSTELSPGDVGTLIRALYSLMDENQRAIPPSFMEEKEIRLSDADMAYLKEQDPALYEEGARIHSIWKRASFIWDEESDCITWTLEKPDTIQPDFLLSIRLQANADEGRTLSCEVDFRSFCRALCRGVDQMLRKAGFGGYSATTGWAFFPIAEYIYVKAFALGREEEVRPRFKEPAAEEEMYTSSFQKEMEILAVEIK